MIRAAETHGASRNTDELLEVCLHLLSDPDEQDETVQAAASDALTSLTHSSQQSTALLPE